MSTYIIADLRLFNEEQRKKMGYDSFEQMNQNIIKTWNKSIKPEDRVIIMGDCGNGTFEQMQSIISQLNGELVATSSHINEKFSKKEWRKIGFKFFWGVSMYHTLASGEDVLYPIRKIENASLYEKDYVVLATDSENEFDGFIKGRMLSVDAAKWGYNPVNVDELLNIYNNMKEFEQMSNEEHRSDVRDEGEE